MKLKDIWAGWKNLRSNIDKVVSINQRNLHYIYPYNPRRYFPLADNKLLNKENMRAAGVATPPTYKVYKYFFELERLEEELAAIPEFVIKPALGRAGGGIVVITKREGGRWIGIDGKAYDVNELKSHISNILFGIYSFDMKDQAIIEQRIRQHPQVEEISNFGLADVRVLMFKDEPVIAMLRIPTESSGGKSNLHQGAFGVGVDLDSGLMTQALHLGRPTTIHPDSGIDITGRAIPFWEELLAMSKRAARAVPLKYLGVDISITPEGPILLEVNARPGLEIQNVNSRGIGEILSAM